MKGPWTYKVKKRGGHGGQTVMFYFQGREFAERVWYPPWRNEQERDNAECIVDDLNKAFAQRNAAEKIFIPATRLRSDGTVNVPRRV